MNPKTEAKIEAMADEMEKAVGDHMVRRHWFIQGQIAWAKWCERLASAVEMHCTCTIPEGWVTEQECFNCEVLKEYREFLEGLNE